MIEKIVKGCHLKHLDNIIQWQEKDVFKNESVSQHSFKVAVFTRVILEDIFGKNNYLNIVSFKLDCVTHAIFHDFDESIFLRDVSHSIKYNKFNGSEIRDAINHYVKHEFLETFSDDIKDSQDMLYENIVEVNPCVKKVVKVADWLALLYFCRREINLGNKDFTETYEYCKECLLKSYDVMIDMLRKIFADIKLNDIKDKEILKILEK